MRERREVAAGPNRTSTRNVRQHAVAKALEQEFDRLYARAGVSFRQSVRTKQHRCTNDLVRVWLPHSAGVTSQQTQLQLLRLFLGDRLRDEATEARVDPVGVLACSM